MFNFSRAVALLCCALPAAAQVAPLRGPTAEPAAVSPADFASLLKRVQSSDLGARKSAVAAMGTAGNIQAIPHLGPLLLQQAEPAELRVAAALALGGVRNWRSLPFLRISISDPLKEIRFASALALGKTRGSEAVTLLARALREDTEWWVRFAAALGLGDSRDSAAVHALGRAAVDEKEWQVRLQAVRSLGKMGSRDAALALAGPLRDADPAVRAAAAMALGEIGGLDSLNLLTGALHDETDDYARQVASEMIKKLLARP